MTAPIVVGLAIVLAAALAVQAAAWLFGWYDRYRADRRMLAHRESLDRIGRDRYAMNRHPGESDRAFRRRMIEYGRRPMALTLADIGAIARGVPGVDRAWALETGSREVTVYVRPPKDEVVEAVHARLSEQAPPGIRYRVVAVQRVG